MKLSNKDYTNKLLFTVEEGQFNAGNFDKAILMIELAALVEADAIEFQLAIADDFYIKSNPAHLIYKKREFSDSQITQLIKATHDKGLLFIATCLSHNLVDKLLKFGADAYNINASDINNPAIVDSVVNTKLPFFISLPLAKENEIEWIINRINQININAQFALLHGQHPMASGSKYVDPEDTALGYIETAKQIYKRKVGFVDHTKEIWTPAAAVGAGAEIITKHLAPNHIYQESDHALCLNPEEMKMSIQYAKSIFQSLQIRNKVLAKGEDIDRTAMRRSIVSSEDISKGTLLKHKHLVFKRPGNGIAPDQAEALIGKELIVDVLSDTIILNDMLKN